MRKVQQALQQAVLQPWIKTFMRLGYAAKGILYLFIGLPAGRAALLPYAEAGGSKSVLLALVDQPFVWLFLSFLAVSLLGYVVRRFLQAILNSGHCLTVQTALQRFDYFLSGSSYLGISYSAFLVAV